MLENFGRYLVDIQIFLKNPKSPGIGTWDPEKYHPKAISGKELFYE